MYTKLADQTNYLKADRNKSAIKFLVVHYTAGNGDTARGNLSYFSRPLPAGKKASAHYFIDENEVCCSVPWSDVAYHCGGGKATYRTEEPRFYGECKNANSIGIEICSRKDKNGKYYFKPETLQNAIKFIASLMTEYNIPIDRVIRHYDVTCKVCPAPFVNDVEAWEKFKLDILKQQRGDVEELTYYEKIDEVPAGEMREVVRYLVGIGVIKGNGNGLHLSHDMVRMLVFMHRRFTTVN